MYPRVLWEYLSLDIPSKNLLGADNQQERLFLAGWIVGMTDGEGCFSISIFKNVTTRLGWQVMPEFVVTQYDSHHEQLYRFCVRNRQDLEQKIVPFFRQYSLQTAKRLDFERFCKVLLMMKDKKHLSESGLNEIRQIVKQKMEEESSETIRGTFKTRKRKKKI